MSAYVSQLYPGTSRSSINRRKYMDPKTKYEKLRSISDEDLVRVLGHRKPGEAYKTVHPPLAVSYTHLTLPTNREV